MQIKKAAVRRKQEDADFEQKRMSLGITADIEEEDINKENIYKHRETRLHTKKGKEGGEYEEESHHRRTRDDGSRWREGRDSSPYSHRVCWMAPSCSFILSWWSDHGLSCCRTKTEEDEGVTGPSPPRQTGILSHVIEVCLSLPQLLGCDEQIFFMTVENTFPGLSSKWVMFFNNNNNNNDEQVYLYSQIEQLTLKIRKKNGKSTGRPEVALNYSSQTSQNIYTNLVCIESN